MSTEPNVLKARNKMLAVLDKKYKNDPSWQAFRAIDELFIAGMNGAARAHTENESLPRTSRPNPRGRNPGPGGSLGDIGVAAIMEAKRPVTTDEMVAHVATLRELGPDSKRARINVQSAMSHADRIVSVKWRGGRAWWIKDREVPDEN